MCGGFFQYTGIRTTNVAFVTRFFRNEFSVNAAKCERTHEFSSKVWTELYLSKRSENKGSNEIWHGESNFLSMPDGSTATDSRKYTQILLN